MVQHQPHIQSEARTETSRKPIALPALSPASQRGHHGRTCMRSLMRSSGAVTVFATAPAAAPAAKRAASFGTRANRARGPTRITRPAYTCLEGEQVKTHAAEVIIVGGDGEGDRGEEDEELGTQEDFL
ncbi:unnamed protein product [Spirodela intermedia]|uniref:Uncharacterized protein n=1 Tax=Spirodela intermedia TaxID=51605 RepID=A0A7I8IC30_SPIIN|nr:unnamed protein product [Spirodela intermedia]CAA6655148.1 unnamed protein product [Spirodela intermedia]